MSENNCRVIAIHPFEKKSTLELPLFSAKIAAGFPSPADDFMERKLDLNEFLIKHPSSTFFVRVAGDSMINAGIHPNDILIVDKSLEISDGAILIAVLNGEFTVKRYRKINGRQYLYPDNPSYQPMELNEQTSFEVWGVVTNVIHKV